MIASGYNSDRFSGQAIQANEFVEKLPWDTEFFKMNVAQLKVARIDSTTLAAVLDWCEQEQVMCLYYEADINDPTSIHLAESSGFKLVDVRMVLGIDLRYDVFNDSNDFVEGLIIRPFKKEDITALELIAKEGFKISRYYFDTDFPAGACERLYIVWIRNSCNGFADEVLVAELKGQPVGFLTCKAYEGFGRIILVGVDPKFRGRSIGSHLVSEAVRWFRNNGLNLIKVVTQARNIGAQRLYQAAGFKTLSVSLFYHKWFKDLPGS